MERSAAPPAARQVAHWRSVRWLTGGLLLVWAVFGLGVHYFARELAFSFFGWPLSFWMAAQGSLLVFALIIFVYERCMDRLDRRHGLEEGQP